MNEKQKLLMAYGVYPSSIDLDAPLQLTHPKNITDEHCIELFDLIHRYDMPIEFSVKEKIKHIKGIILGEAQLSYINVYETIISFLRSKGYAFQCNGRSIKEQVESGDVELK